jgi:hypothetical protein
MGRRFWNFMRVAQIVSFILAIVLVVYQVYRFKSQRP